MFTVDFDAYERKGFIFRRATADDAGAVADILHAAARKDASEQERAEKGFVQGRMGLEGATAWISAGSEYRGAMVVETNQQVVGVLFFSPVPVELDGPHMVVGIASAVHAHPELQLQEALAYGPLAVSDDHAGHGLGKALISRVGELAEQGGFTYLVASVEDANRKSLGFHQHLGAEKIGTFERDGRPYSVVAFKP